MSPQPGSTLGVYTIVSSIGAGGMGEVYRATDTKLNRDVAIKVLPDIFSADADRLARFTREAQTLAALNHPNIAQIFGIEESSGVRALVMEFVEGEDLSRKIAGQRAQGFQSTMSCPSRGRLLTPSRPRTSRALSIAISSPQISRSGLTAR